MSYAIPPNELTLTDIKAYKQICLQAGIARALALGIAVSEQELVWREALPHTDFGAAGLGWLTEEYLTAGAVAGPAWISAFDAGVVPANAPTLPVGRIAVFYKFADTEDAPLVTAVRFRVGANGASTKGLFFVQLPITANEEPVVFFNEPVVYDPQDIVYIEAYVTAATPGAGEHIPFGCFIIERVGAQVS